MNTLCERPASLTTTRPDPAGSAPGLDTRSYLARMGVGVASLPEPRAAIRPAGAQARLEPECLMAWRRNLADIRRATTQSQAAAPGDHSAAVAGPQPQVAAQARDASLYP